MRQPQTQKEPAALQKLQVPAHQPTYATKLLVLAFLSSPYLKIKPTDNRMFINKCISNVCYKTCTRPAQVYQPGNPGGCENVRAASA